MALTITSGEMSSNITGVIAKRLSARPAGCPIFLWSVSGAEYLGRVFTEEQAIAALELAELKTYAVQTNPVFRDEVERLRGVLAEGKTWLATRPQPLNSGAPLDAP
ncbi:hypothetical protein [Spirillospora sp. NPDC047279]|uniref:hypothetical protein n=1 Tax=Spirillospora sp. NPDC047279 TaxID=3155478 RepID=UPI0033C3C03C